MNEDTYPRVRVGGNGMGFHYDSDGLLKIVPADAIVIERADVPEVVRETDRYVLCGGARYVLHDRAEEHWDVAVEQLALAEYRREHPPVDEREVEALAHMFAARNLAYPNAARETARSILATGRVHVDVEEADRG